MFIAQEPPFAAAELHDFDVAALCSPDCAPVDSWACLDEEYLYVTLAHGKVVPYSRRLLAGWKNSVGKDQVCQIEDGGAL
jgi:hypothetical protein